MGLILTAANAKARLDGGAIPACVHCGERIPAADIAGHESVCDGRGSSEREGARYQMPMNAVIAAVRGALIRGGARTAIDTSAAAALLTDADGAAIAAALEDAGADIDDVEIWEWQRMDAADFGRGLIFGARSGGGANPYSAGARLCGYCGASYHGGEFCDSPADVDGADIIIGADGAGISDTDIIIVSGAILVCAVCGMRGANIGGACEGGYEHTWALGPGADDVEILPGDFGADAPAARRADTGGATVGAMRHGAFADGVDWDGLKRGEGAAAKPDADGADSYSHYRRGWLNGVGAAARALSSGGEVDALRALARALDYLQAHEGEGETLFGRGADIVRARLADWDGADTLRRRG